MGHKLTIDHTRVRIKIMVEGQSMNLMGGFFSGFNKGYSPSKSVR